MLGVPAVAAHVPLAHCARATRFGIGTAHIRDDEIVDRDVTCGRGLDDAPERLVSEYETVATGRRGAVCTLDDLAISAAHTDGAALDEQLAVAKVGFGDVVETRRPRRSGLNRDRFHDVDLSCWP
jgi:hypothetical protein